MGVSAWEGHKKEERRTSRGRRGGGCGFPWCRFHKNRRAGRCLASYRSGEGRRKNEGHMRGREIPRPEGFPRASYRGNEGGCVGHCRGEECPPKELGRSRQNVPRYSFACDRPEAIGRRASVFSEIR